MLCCVMVDSLPLCLLGGSWLCVGPFWIQWLCFSTIMFSLSSFRWGPSEAIDGCWTPQALSLSACMCCPSNHALQTFSSNLRILLGTKDVFLIKMMKKQIYNSGTMIFVYFPLVMSRVVEPWRSGSVWRCTLKLINEIWQWRLLENL